MQTNSFNWLTLKAKRDAYIARLNGIYERNLGNDKVDYVKGFASLVDKNTVKVQNGDVSSEIKAKNILITVGRWSQFVYLQRLFRCFLFFLRWSSNHSECAWC